MPALIYPLMVAAALHAGGAACWLLLPFNLLLVPLLDHAARAGAPGWQPGVALRRFCYAPPWFWLYALAQGWMLYAALQRVPALTPLEFFGLASSVGLMTGTAGITAAHELIHRLARAERGVGLLLLGMVGYQHFRIEHVYGHHRNAGTDDDPASARLGEGFPAFFARSVAGGLAGAWRIECARRRARGLRVCALGNRCLQYLVVQLLLCGAILGAFGAAALLFFLLQCFVAVHLLEAVNYVQHYGLRRAQRADGLPTSLTARQVWDSDSPFSALFTFNLSTHAAHHLRALQPAHELGAHAQAPRLPLSFFLMVFLALIPPLWFRLMDHRARLAAGAAASSGDNPSPLTVQPA